MGKLTGMPPQEFTGDHSQSKKYLLEFDFYKAMNHNAKQMTIPYLRCILFLSMIREDLVDDWVMDQNEWINRELAGGHNAREEYFWTTIRDWYKDAFTDGAEKQKAQQELQDIKWRKEIWTHT
jgi:hypothetical protein